MTDREQLATRLEQADPKTADLRKLSDLVLLALGWNLKPAEYTLDGYLTKNPRAYDSDGVLWKPVPSPTESVDDGLALAGDDWEAILDQAFCRCSDIYENSGGAPLEALPRFICAALLRAKEQETASE